MKKHSKFDMWMAAIFVLSILAAIISLLGLMWAEDIFCFKLFVTFATSAGTSLLAIAAFQPKQNTDKKD